MLTIINILSTRKALLTMKSLFLRVIHIKPACCNPIIELLVIESVKQLMDDSHTLLLACKPKPELFSSSFVFPFVCMPPTLLNDHIQPCVCRAVILERV